MKKQNDLISVQELTEQLALAAKDEFVCLVAKENDSLTMTFINGQKFSLSIKEVTSVAANSDIPTTV